MFKRNQKARQSGHSNQSISYDPIHADVPRGIEGRKRHESFLPKGYFETLDALIENEFTDGAGDHFLGVVGAKTQLETLPNGRRENVTRGGIAIGCSDDRHRTIVAGSRSGKGRSAIIPELLSYAGSMIVIDPKGENAARTARYRAETLKQNVCVLDPFGETPSHCEPYRKQFNPLRMLKTDSLTVIEDAGLLADALVVSTNSKDAHWDDSSKAFIEGLILFVVFGDFDESEQNLLTVAELLAGKRHDSIKALVSEMIDFGGPDNRVAAAAITMKERGDQERGSVLSTARRNLKFLDYDAMYAALTHHDFDLEVIKGETPMTLYLVLPTMRMSTCRQLLRIFVNLTLMAVEKNKTPPRYPVQLILDEMATLGYMRELENAIGQIAGLGLKITSVLQDLNQLKSLYNDRYETFLGNSGILQFFGNVDFFTTEWLSKYLGNTAIAHEQLNPTSIDAKIKGQSGRAFQTQTVPLMTPEEVRRYLARGDLFNRQLILVPGERPWLMQRANYDTHELFEGRFDEWF